jgi:hypothetical protein
MSLVQSARLYGQDPWAYLNEALARLPTQLNSRIDEPSRPRVQCAQYARVNPPSCSRFAPVM